MIGCGSTIKSEKTEAIDFKKSEAYCIIPNSFSHDNLSQRYTGTCVGSPQSAAFGKFNLVRECFASYDTVIDGMKTEWTTNVLNLGLALSNEIKAVLPLNNHVKDSPFIKNLGSFADISTMTDCTHASGLFKDLIAQYCFNFIG